MGGKFVLAVLFTLVLIISSNVYVLSFAEEKVPPPNNTFIDINSLDSGSHLCGAEFEFRTIQVKPNRTDKNNVDFDITTSSLFFSVTQGVLGNGFDNDAKTTNSSLPVNENFTVRCYDGSDDTTKEKPKFSIKKEDENLNSFYEIEIDNKSLGLVTPASFNFDSQKSTENNSSFLIVTGSDACGSYGAYRMVNVNFKESSDEEWISEIDVYSLFFNKTTDKTTGKITYPLLGNGIIYNTLEGSVKQYQNNTKSYIIDNSWGLIKEVPGEKIDLDKEIKLDNNINCKDEKSELTDEKFGITIRGDGTPNLNLPPIRPKN